MSITQSALGREWGVVACGFLVTYYREFTKEGEPLALLDMYADNSHVVYAEYNENVAQIVRGRHEILQHLEKMDATLGRRKVEVRFADFSPIAGGSVLIVTQGIMYVRGSRKVFTQSFVLAPTPNRSNTYHIASEYFRVLHVEMERIPEGSIIMTPVQVAQHLLGEQERRKREEEAREHFLFLQKQKEEQQQQQQQMLQCADAEMVKQQENDRALAVENQSEAWDKHPRGQDRRMGRKDYRNRAPAGARSEGVEERKERAEWEMGKPTESKTNEAEDDTTGEGNERNRWEQPRRSEPHRRPERVKRNEGGRRAEGNDQNEVGRPERRDRRDAERQPRDGESRRGHWGRNEEKVDNVDTADNTRVTEGDAARSTGASGAASERTRRNTFNNRPRDRFRNRELQQEQQPAAPADSAAAVPATASAADNKGDAGRNDHKPLPRSEANRRGRGGSKEAKNNKKEAWASEKNDANNGGAAPDAAAAEENVTPAEQRKKFPRSRADKKIAGEGTRLEHRKGPTDHVRLIDAPKGQNEQISAAIKRITGEEPKKVVPFGRGNDIVCQLSTESAAEALLEKPPVVNECALRVARFYP